MIAYRRVRGIGFSYLFHLRGSLLPYCLPAMIFSGVLAGIISCEALSETFDESVRDNFNNSYALQAFAIVFGYLSVQRLTMSYNRYWEG